jgi:membrane protein
MGWMAESYRRFEHLCRRGIWQPAALAEKTLRGRLYAVLRVISITYAGLFENHITTRAAALSYASLLGLGPLVALAMLVAGFMLNQRDPAVAVNTLNRVIKFIAPQVAQYEHLDSHAARPPANAGIAPADAAAGGTGAPAANPALSQLIESFIAGSRSGTAGAIGALTLILIVIQLFTWVENAFNAVWGVRRGRSWLLRVVFYWTIITLGTVLFFASLTALSAAAFISVFFEKLSFGPNLLSALRWMLPLLSIVLLVAILTLFYRYIPNTRVFWRAALAGALIVTALLYLNNYLAFLYFKRVVLQKSLYGSLGILPILMLGLYIFWFFVLVGGQISYALQNVRYRSSQAAWHNLSETTREGLSLLTLLVICRRFKECGPAYSVSQLGQLIKVPTQVINECLNRLGDLGLVAAIPPAEGQASLDYRYQPARPLHRITLAGFKHVFENFGENPSTEALDAADPVLRLYHERLTRHLPEALGPQTLDELLEEFPAGPAAAPGGAR